jgi:hypothetical protein
VLEQFIEDVNSTQCIMFGDNLEENVLGHGKVVISKDLSLENVMLVKSLGCNLISILYLASTGYNYYFSYNHVKVFRSDNLKLVCVGYVETNFTWLLSQKRASLSLNMSNGQVYEACLWHRR